MLYTVHRSVTGEDFDSHRFVDFRDAHSRRGNHSIKRASAVSLRVLGISIFRKKLLKYEIRHKCLSVNFRSSLKPFFEDLSVICV